MTGDKRIILMALLTAVAMCGCAPEAERSARVVFSASAAPLQSVRDELQATIDHLAESGGGTLVIPPGRFRTGGIFLKSGITLELSEGAVLEGDERLCEYPPIGIRHSELGDNPWQALIAAVRAENVAVVGKGTIDGRGESILGHYYKPTRPRGLLFYKCRNVRVEDVRLVNAMSWMCYFKECEGVLARGVKIWNHGNVNNDGFDIEASDVLIENCLVDTGDDAICLKSDNPDFRMTNVTVRNCTVASQCCAFKIGTASRGMVSGIEFSDSQIVACDFSSGRKAAVIHDTMKDIRGVTDERTGMSALAVENVDGAVLRDVTVKDIIFDGYATPFFVRFGSRSPSSRTDGLPPRLENVVFERVKGIARSSIASSVTGVPGLRPRGIVFRNVTVTVPGGGTTADMRDTVPEVAGGYPQSYMFDRKVLPACGFYVRHSDGVKFENVKIVRAGEDAREDIVLDDCR